MEAFQTQHFATQPDNQSMEIKFEKSFTEQHQELLSRINELPQEERARKLEIFGRAMKAMEAFESLELLISRGNETNIN